MEREDNGRSDTTLRVSKGVRNRFFILNTHRLNASDFLDQLLNLWEVTDKSDLLRGLKIAIRENRQHNSTDQTG